MLGLSIPSQDNAILRISGFRLSGRVSTDDGPKDMSVRIPELGVRAGEVTAIIGGSGCGKSVLLSVLMGYPAFGVGGRLERTEFRLFGKGMPPSAFRSMKTAAEWRRALAPSGGLFYLPQAFPVAKTQRARTRTAMIQIVQAMAAPLHLSRRDAQQEIQAAFDKRNLQSTLAKKLDALSGGERRRVELLARLVAMKAMKGSNRQALLVLDEPTTGFDPENALDFIRIVRIVIDELGKDGIPAAALLTTHEMTCLDDHLGGRRVVDRVCIVHRDAGGDGDGDCTVLFDGPADSVWAWFFPSQKNKAFSFSSDGDDLFKVLKKKKTDEWLSQGRANEDNHNVS